MFEEEALVGQKFKIKLKKQIKSMKLIVELEEILERKYVYNKLKSFDDLLSMEKIEKGVEYRLDIKQDIMYFYTNANLRHTEDAITEYMNVLGEIRGVIYSYMGHDPAIRNIVYTKGYAIKSDELADYLASNSFRFNSPGVNCSIKYDCSKKMNLLLRRYFVDEKYVNEYLDNIEKYTLLLV